MKYLLRLLIVIFCIGLFALLWFFNLRSTKKTYINTAPISTKVNQDKTANFDENRNAYFGDLHVHTSWSFDAFIFNVRTSPDDAYRYGKGVTTPADITIVLYSYG